MYITHVSSVFVRYIAIAYERMRGLRTTPASAWGNSPRYSLMSDFISSSRPRSAAIMGFLGRGVKFCCCCIGYVRDKLGNGPFPVRNQCRISQDGFIVIMFVCVYFKKRHIRTSYRRRLYVFICDRYFRHLAGMHLYQFAYLVFYFYTLLGPLSQVFCLIRYRHFWFPLRMLSSV